MQIENIPANFTSQIFPQPQPQPQQLLPNIPWTTTSIFITDKKAKHNFMRASGIGLQT